MQARISVDQPRDLRVIRNVIGRLRGKAADTVVAGAHRDSWVRGANDDGAGTVSMLRAAQLLGAKAQGGWKPERTITLGFWDAEEFGLIGSTEWGEANEAWLRAHAVAYVNADTAVNGPRFRGAGGSPGMLSVLKDVLARIPAAPSKDGASTGTLWDEWCALAKERAKAPGDPAEPRLGLPGSGSDFAVFVHHLNVPCLEPGFGGSGGSGGYHRRLFAELLAEIADKPAFFDDVEAAKELAQRAREAADDTALAESAGRIAKAFDDAAQKLDGHAPSVPFYRQLEVPTGLAGRPWFRNRLWAPGLEDGYGSETFPTLRVAATKGKEALEGETNALIESIDALVTSAAAR